VPLEKGTIYSVVSLTSNLPDEKIRKITRKKFNWPNIDLSRYLQLPPISEPAAKPEQAKAYIMLKRGGVPTGDIV
jgi:hypothetical protein